MPLANSDGMCISTLGHLGLHDDLVVNSQVDTSVFFRRTTATCDQDVRRIQRDRGGALIEFVARAVSKLLKSPLIFIDIVAKADLRVDIVAK